MSGQFLVKSAIGQNKAVALKLLLQQTCEDIEIQTYGKYEEDSECHHIVFACFDNMSARSIAFFKWFDYLKGLSKDSQERKEAVFLDGRLLCEQMQVIVVRFNNEDINKYNREYLFDDKEVEDLECTFKQTSHCAAMIASLMVNQFINHMAQVNNIPARKVSFYSEYLSPLNMFMKC